MEDVNRTDSNTDESSEWMIDIFEALQSLWAAKWIILIAGFVAWLGAYVYGKSLNDVYTADAMLIPAGGNTLVSMSSYMSPLGALGIGAGASFSPSSGHSLEVLKSRQFFKDHIYEEVAADMLAFEKWDKETKEVTYNKDLYDVSTGNWTVDPTTGESLRMS